MIKTIKTLKTQITQIKTSLKQIKSNNAYPNISNQIKRLFTTSNIDSICNKEELIKEVQFHISGIDENIKGAKKGDSKLYILSFECKKCNKRNTKTCTQTAYHKGLVVIRCDGCSSFHLIADNLGWVRDDKKNIEEIAIENKENVCKVDLSSMMSSNEDMNMKSNDCNIKIYSENENENEKKILKSNKKNKYVI